MMESSTFGIFWKGDGSGLAIAGIGISRISVGTAESHGRLPLWREVMKDEISLQSELEIQQSATARDDNSL
jgi:hypothetical protein